MPSFYLFMTFTSEVKQMWHMYKYVLKHPFREDRFKQKNQNVVFRDYILTLASYTVHSRVYSQEASNLKSCLLSEIFQTC